MVAVELRREESPGALQDLVGPAELPVFTLQAPQPFTFLGREPGAESFVGLGDPHPAAEGLSGHAKLVADRADRRLLRGVLVLVLEHHPDGPFTDLRRIPGWSCHGPTSHESEPPRIPGRFGPSVSRVIFMCGPSDRGSRRTHSASKARAWSDSPSTWRCGGVGSGRCHMLDG
jgi:hypothetical protein